MFNVITANWEVLKLYNLIKLELLFDSYNLVNELSDVRSLFFIWGNKYGLIKTPINNKL